VCKNCQKKKLLKRCFTIILENMISQGYPSCLPEKTEKEDKKYLIKRLFENHCFFDKV